MAVAVLVCVVLALALAVAVAVVVPVIVAVVRSTHEPHVTGQLIRISMLNGARLQNCSVSAQVTLSAAPLHRPAAVVVVAADVVVVHVPHRAGQFNRKAEPSCGWLQRSTSTPHPGKSKRPLQVPAAVVVAAAAAVVVAAGAAVVVDSCAPQSTMPEMFRQEPIESGVSYEMQKPTPVPPLGSGMKQSEPGESFALHVRPACWQRCSSAGETHPSSARAPSTPRASLDMAGGRALRARRPCCARKNGAPANARLGAAGGASCPVYKIVPAQHRVGGPPRSAPFSRPLLPRKHRASQYQGAFCTPPAGFWLSPTRSSVNNVRMFVRAGRASAVRSAEKRVPYAPEHSRRNLAV